MIVLQDVQSVCKTPAGVINLQKFINSLNKHLPEYNINTKPRIASFLAQCMHESGEFGRLTENLRYNASRLAAVWPKRFKDTNGLPNNKAVSLANNPEAVANSVYGDRLGNGPEASGDGWKYRGRGVFQLTGKSNYAICSEAIKVDILNNPDLCTSPDCAVLTACWFWKVNNLEKYADKSDMEGMTRAINGGVIGLPDRVRYFNLLMVVL